MKAYFTGLVRVLLFALAAHALLTAYVANRGSLPVEAEYWVGDELIFKKFLADNAGAGRRILIFSGSSSLFGVDSGLIERRRGLKTLNLSAHGGLSLDFQLDYADGIVRAGDVVILPLEYEYYQRPPGDFADGSWPLALAVFPETFRALPMLERLWLLLHLEPRTLWDGAYVSMRRLVQPGFMRQRSQPDLQRVLLKWKNSPHTGPTQYGVEGTNERGDIERNCASADADWNYSIAKSSFRIDPDSIGAIKRQAIKWKERGAKVYLSFPPISTDVLATPDFQKNTARLSDMMEKMGIETLGQPNDFLFPRHAFYDNRYHLNCDGRVTRTLILLRELAIHEASGVPSARVRTMSLRELEEECGCGRRALLATPGEAMFPPNSYKD